MAEHVAHRSPALTLATRRAFIRRAAGVSSAVIAARRPRSIAAAPETLRVAVGFDIDTFDPAFTVGAATAQTVIQNTFDQLTQYQIVTRTDRNGVRYQAVDTKIINPMLCSSWRAEGSDLVFTLPEGLVFANGDPVDAGAIVEGYRRIFGAKGISSFLLSMGGGVADESAFIARDPRTFVIRMTKPNVLIPQNNVMHNTSALDPTEIAAHATSGDPWATRWFEKNLGTGNGPYKLASYVPADAITLVANERHPGPAPAFTRVVLKIIPDPNQRAGLLEKGDVDFAMAMPWKDLDTLAASGGVRVQSLPSTLVEYVGLNATIPPFDRKQVRQAVAWAIPYQQIVDSIYKGRAQLATGLVPIGMPTRDPAAPRITDLDQARALLAAAGFPGGAGLPDVALTVQVGDEEAERITIVMEDALKQIGFPAAISKLSQSAFGEGLGAGTLQAWVGNWISWVNDPFYHLFWLTASQSPANYARLNNADLDRLINDNLLAEATPEREQASRAAQAIVADESTYLAICQPDIAICTRNDIAGYVRYNDELPRFALMSRQAG